MTRHVSRSSTVAASAIVALGAALIGLPLDTAGAQPGPTPPTKSACANTAMDLGVSRIVEIDTSTGPLFGAISVETREPRFLGPKEVVLTFDDGPMPAVTRPILDTLDKFCTKATFYSVGRMAIAYPAMTREIMARGHTLGTHTWSHPLNLKRLSLTRAIDEIEKGHAAVTMAAGQPIAPFFRFPGLSDSGPMLKHLQGRGIGAFTVDVVSNDSYISDADRLLQRTLREVETHDGGIVLFHDIKAVTARILPRFLTELKLRGYKVVHIRPKATVAPVKQFDSDLVPMLVKAEQNAAAPGGGARVPFYGAVKPGETGDRVVATGAAGAGVAAASGAPAISAQPLAPVETLVPVARTRIGGGEASTKVAQGSGYDSDDDGADEPVKKRPRPVAKPPAPARQPEPASKPWSPFD
jgi:peptidoglycan/xylan/chitin deacetylase (PgdA/CDA1 family)